LLFIPFAPRLSRDICPVTLFCCSRALPVRVRVARLGLGLDQSESDGDPHPLPRMRRLQHGIDRLLLG